jgi:hypothetical protein
LISVNGRYPSLFLHLCSLLPAPSRKCPFSPLSATHFVTGFGESEKVRWVLCILYAAILAAFGCADGTEPEGELFLTMQHVAGIYYGRTFSTEQNGVTTNQLWLGATIDLVLYSAGTTDGVLSIPPDSTGLNGTWQLEGNTVTLSQVNDNLFNGMSLVFDQTHLTGEITRDSVTYRVVLAL